MDDSARQISAQTADTKYHLLDENGMLVFRYSRNSFLSSNAPIGCYTYPVLKIAVVIAGEADWSFRKMVYHVRMGDIAILRTSTPRSIDRIAPDNSFECDIYEFLPAFLKYSVDDLSLFYVESDGKNDIIPADAPDSGRLCRLFAEIRDELCSPGILCGELIRGLLMASLALMSRAIGLRPAGDRETVVISSANHPVYDYGGKQTDKTSLSVATAAAHAFDMSYISNLINGGIAGEIRIDDLARAVHMSRSHFFKIFHQYTGMSVNDYILRCRIDNTIKLLLSSDSTILDAAYQSGFTSSAGFYKAFRRITGVTPKEYLKSVTEHTSERSPQ